MMAIRRGTAPFSSRHRVLCCTLAWGLAGCDDSGGVTAEDSGGTSDGDAAVTPDGDASETPDGDASETPDAVPDLIPSGPFPPTGAELLFAAIGDFGDTVDLDEDETDTLHVAELVKSWDPSFIITVGDNDYSDGEFEGTFEGLELGVGQYFHEYIGDYAGSEGEGAEENRFFPVAGDHDYGDDCDNPRLDDYLDYFTLPVGETDETYYSFRRGPVELFALDSIVDCHQDDGAKLDQQRAWLEEAASSSDAPFRIAYFHNPPYSSGANHGSAEHMQWPFGDWGIQLVLSGDDHVYERVERDGVTYLVIGLGGVDIHEFGSPVAGSLVRYNDDYGALGVAVFGDRLDVAFVSVAGEEVDRFILTSDGVGGSDLDPDAPPVTEGDWFRPGTDTSWQWQLQGALNTDYDVDVYDVDLFDTDATQIAALQADNRRVICYFSAGSYEDFRPDADEFAEADLGAPLEDFADERWLDIRSSNVARIMAERLDLAVTKGCDGVEPDNVDGYANDTGLPLTATNQLAFNRFVANEAHRRGLTVGLKNDLDQIPELLAYYDFALNEQCHEYDECELLDPFVEADKAVFVAEYDAAFVDDAEAREAMCAAARDQDVRVLVLPLDLDDSFRFSCDP